jgi:hypothetical protein
MYRNLTFFVALSLLVSSAATAETRCAAPTDQAAFDVGALKSELSILAVDCHNEDDYNKFVERYRSELVSQDGVVNAWFKRSYGRSAQPHYDTYITLLANDQSQVGLRQGTEFCPRLKTLFTEVMSLPDSTVLAQYAAAKDLIPSTVGSCEIENPPAVQHHPVRRATRRHR